MLLEYYQLELVEIPLLTGLFFCVVVKWFSKMQVNNELSYVLRKHQAPLQSLHNSLSGS